MGDVTREYSYSITCFVDTSNDDTISGMVSNLSKRITHSTVLWENGGQFKGLGDEMIRLSALEKHIAVKLVQLFRGIYKHAVH